MENNRTEGTKGGFSAYLLNNKIKCIILAVFLLLAVVGLILSRGVKINYNLADYLSKDTETSIGLEIMTDEFGVSGNIQVMLEGIEKSAAKKVVDRLSSIEGVLSVAFDENSSASYKEDTKSALFNIVVDGDDSSETAQYVIKEIKSRLGSIYGTVELGGSTIEYTALRENTTKEMGIIIAFALTLATIILLVTASSWIEPLILLGTSGIAIAINMGLNIFLGEISYITNSVAAILQLALSIDYSVALIHAYKDEKRSCPDSTEAMRRTVKHVMNPVSASALTTVAGLVALLFMSFTIGFDIGIVLIKGIVVSAVTSLTLLPVVVLMLEKVLEKTRKRPFVPGGVIFSGIAIKFNKIIVPAAAALVIVAAVLQMFNSYGFTDSIGSNEKIADTFGRNDSIVVLYRKGESEDDFKKEEALHKALADYKNKDGISTLASYTAYSNTVRELYTVEKAAEMFGLPKEDVELLFTMYNLYNNKSAVKMTPSEFVSFATELVNSDPDAAEMMSEETRNAVKLLNIVKNVMPKKNTSAELYNEISSLMPDNETIAFALDQIYGLYFYDEVTNPKIKVKTLLGFLYTEIDTLYDLGILSKETIGFSATEIKAAIMVFNTPGDNATQKAFLESTVAYDELLSGLETVLPTMSLPDGVMLPTKFDPDLNDAVKQLYIMYFNKYNMIPTGRVLGRDLVSFVSSEIEKNAFISAQLDGPIMDGIEDLKNTDILLSDNTEFDFSEMAAKINNLASSIKFMEIDTVISEDMISGVYIKEAAGREENGLLTPMMSYQLLNFITDKMETNSLLSSKIPEEYREKLDEAAEMVSAAEELFLGDEYSRVLVSAVVPAEGPEMVAFVDYMLEKIDEIFGDDAYITGKVVSTYDLQAAFTLDNTVITIFTIVSILLVILFVFKSLSLPPLLVLIIQGAVWISLSFQLLTGNSIFFMSYIMTSCILMGSTVDYGILLSSNYIVYRKSLDKVSALLRAVDSAMPTVFTSGTVLIVCGVVISIISSQDSIASVGMLLALGALTSIVMITVALPSVLYLLDGFILKFTHPAKDEKAIEADKEN